MTDVVPSQNYLLVEYLVLGESERASLMLQKPSSIFFSGTVCLHNSFSNTTSDVYFLSRAGGVSPAASPFIPAYVASEPLSASL